MTYAEMFDNLIEYGIATDSEIQLVAQINGFSIDTLNSILYARTAYHDWESYYEDELFEENDWNDDVDETGFDPYEGCYTFDC